MEASPCLPKGRVQGAQGGCHSSDDLTVPVPELKSTSLIPDFHTRLMLDKRGNFLRHVSLPNWNQDVSRSSDVLHGAFQQTPAGDVVLRLHLMSKVPYISYKSLRHTSRH